jgi:CheY-like chemotaxis protein
MNTSRPHASASTVQPQKLIVDDEAIIRDTLRWLLEDAGYVVHEATNGLAAIDLLTTSAAPLVGLLDLKMPTMSGFELLRLLAGKPTWATRHAFIVMTAVSPRFGLSSLMPLLRRLAITLVMKPFDIEDVLAAVGAEVARLQTARAEAGDETA